MKKNFRKTVHLMKMCLFTFFVFLLSACSSVEKIQHIEVFVTEILEQNDEGFYEKTGYKKVNAITTLEEGKNHIKSDIKSIEDFYDIEGSYIKTDITHSNYSKSKVTLAEDGDNRKEVLQEPSTILIPNDNLEHFKMGNMTEEEKEKVKEHVLSHMNIF